MKLLTDIDFRVVSDPDRQTDVRLRFGGDIERYGCQNIIKQNSPGITGEIILTL